MPNDVTEALKHLITTFCAKDIMTSEVRLVCAKKKEEAPEVSAENPDFSVIPILSDDGLLTSYFERDSQQTRLIEVGDLVSDGTTLLDLVDILQTRDFCFVLANRRVGGYVHYSDLNHQIMKWTFYVMLEAVERMALDSLPPAHERALLESKLPPERFKQVLSTYKRAGDNGRNLLTYLNIADLLHLAVATGVLRIDEESIVTMKDVRNWAAHVLFDLQPESSVQKLATVKQECLRILGIGLTISATAGD